MPPRPPPTSNPSGDSSLLKKTAQQMAGEQIMARIVSAADGVAFTYIEALNIANVFLKTSKKQTTRFAGELTIGSNMKISCKVFTKVNSLTMLFLVINRIIEQNDYIYNIYIYI